MEILQIAKGRLKISLSKEELTEYGTNLECLEAGNASAKQALEVIFALVEAKTGLQLTGAQTLIRLFPSKDGGCEIFVLNRERNPSESIPKHSSTCEEHSLLPGDSSRAGFYLCTVKSQRELLFLAKSLYSLGVVPEIFCDAPESAFQNTDSSLPSPSVFYVVAHGIGAAVTLLEEFGQKVFFDPTPFLSEHRKKLSSTEFPLDKAAF